LNKEPIIKQTLFASLPNEWPVDLRSKIRKQVTVSRRKVVVLDDDPTGTQTVHSIPVLTEWSLKSLQAELANDLPAFYILTNSRSFTLDVAKSINSEIGHNLNQAAKLANREFVVVSRSDSTLRGHFPGEVNSLANSLEDKFDGWIMTPFFPEGGRYTINDIHYVAEGERLVPAAQTEFARDRVFGYQSSNLRQWVAEKTQGQIPADRVVSISLEDLREGGPQQIPSFLNQLHSGSVCVVNAVTYRDLEVLVAGLLEAEMDGKKFLYRTAASFVQVRSGLSPRPLLNAQELSLSNSGGGLIVVGSYVPRTTEQLNALLSCPGIIPIEANTEAMLDDKRHPGEIQRIVAKADHYLNMGIDTVIYTSRELISGQDAQSSLAIGQCISRGLITCLKKISATPRYILAKGGITSSDVATDALNVKRAMVSGQILPGIPVWELGHESRYPRMPYIVFPGNVGNSQALVDLVNKLR
jgi:uncharacterized protein YgbK (DUF1537 family)